MQFDNQKTRNVADVVARILAGESAEQEPKMLEEELKGDQHKIDANKNNKIDAHDFKLLRAKKKMKEEAEQIDELKKSTLGSYVKKASKDLAGQSFEHGEDEHRQYGDPEDTERENEMKKRERDIENRQKGINRAATKLSKEETELTESHFKVGDKVKCKTSGMKGEVVKLDKEDGGEDEKYYTVKREDGQMKKMAPSDMTKINEDVEQLDEIGDTPAGKKMLGKYITKRTKQLPQIEVGYQMAPSEREAKMAKKYKSKVQKGIGRAVDRLTKEENEELDEAMFPGTKEYEKKYGQSPQQKLRKKGDTVPTSQGDMTKTDKGIAHRRRFTEMIESYTQGGLKYIATLVKEEPDNEQFTAEVEEQKKRDKGEIRNDKGVAKSLQNASVREDPVNPVREEVEELDELSKSTLGSYAKKASHDARIKMAIGKDFERHAITSRKPEYKAGAKSWEDKYKSDARKREAGVNKAIDRLAKEEVEQIDELDQKTLSKYTTRAKFSSDPKHREGAAKAQAKMSGMSDKLRQGKLNNPMMKSMAKEEVELDESSGGYEVKQSKTDPDVHHVHYNGKKIGSVYGNKKGMWGHEYHPMGTGDDGYSSKKEAVNAVKDDHRQHLNMKEEVELDEREMTDAEMAKREEIVKSMKKGMQGFKDRYGDRAKNVMYATATKQAMKD